MLHVTCYMLHVTCYMLHVTCHMLYVTCYMSHVTCHKLYVTCHMSYVARHMSWMPCILFWVHPNISHMSTWHMLHVIWCILHVTCHTLHVLGNAMDACMLFWVHSTCVTFQSVICDMSHVTCNMPHVTSHVSHVTCPWTCQALFRVLDVGQINWPYRAPRQPKRPKLKIWSSSLPRPDPQNENELWNLIYKIIRNHLQIARESRLWHLAVTWRL